MVTVRAKAFGDPRIAYLGVLLGCSLGEAFYRMTRLWHACAYQQTDKPEVRFIRACLEHQQGEQHLVESGLGDDERRDPSLGAGVVRVRGCDETDWYYAKLERDAQAEAGRARAALAARDAAGRYRSGAPPGSLQPASSQASSQEPASLSPDLGSDLGSAEILSLSASKPDPQTIVGAEREGGAGATVPGRARQAMRRVLFGESWSFASRQHEALRQAGVDPHARSCWTTLPDASSIEAQALFARIDELAATDDPQAFARAKEIIRNRVEVAAAEARRDGTLRWFIPARMWDAKSFAIAKDLSPEQAAQSRNRDKTAATVTPQRRVVARSADDTPPLPPVAAGGRS